MTSEQGYDEVADLRARLERAETILRKLLVPTRLNDDEKAYLLTFTAMDDGKVET